MDASLLGCILAATYFPGRLPREYRRRAWVSRPCSGWERVGHQHYDHQKAVRIRKSQAHPPQNLYGFWVCLGEGAPFLAVRHTPSNPSRIDACVEVCALAWEPEVSTSNKSPSVFLLGTCVPCSHACHDLRPALVSTCLAPCGKPGRKDEMRVGCKYLLKPSVT